MSATVDERIVAAKFDASDFEKGVNKTIKKLDELKQSLNMKDTTKSVNELSEKVKSSTDSMSGSLEKLSNRLTTFVGMIKQNILSGLAQEVSDVFLKMERAVTGFIRSLGSEQVNAGMAKYEQMLSSVRTMMAAGESQDSAYSHIQELRDYSDQTSYSLSQMTDALSKFRAAGVDLDTATKSVEGIANACATAGINAMDAQRAFYNLSQAYSTGSLKYTDYRSLELLNMTTEKFKQNLLEAAEEAGTLKRLSDGTYKTIGKQGEKITKGKKVTLKNIQEALRYGFVTKDVMNKLFGGKYYFSEKEFRNYKKKYTDEHGNLTEAGRQRAIADAKKDFNEYAVEAYLAAREARNFTDVMNTLKDVVSTGWSTTFENLFGKLESATKFFTSLTEGPLADVIYKIGEYRNAILGFFNGEGTDYEGSGAQMIQDIILNLSDAFGILLQTFQQILPGFEELNYEEGKAQPQLEALGNKLREFTADMTSASLRIKEGVEAFNTWMNSPIFDKEEGPSRIEVIRQAISNLLSVFSIAYKLFAFGFNTVIKVAEKAAPIFDAIFAALEKITEPLAALDNNAKPFQDLEDSANNLLKALDPIIEGLTSVLGIVGEVGKFFAEMTIDAATTSLEFFSEVLRFFIDLFKNGESSQSLRDGKSTLDGIREAFEGIKEACSNGLNAVKEFLGSLIKDIRQLFGLVDENGEKIQNGGVFENLKNFFDNNQFIKDAKAWVDKAIIDVSNFIKDIPNKIMKLGANIYDILYKLFFKEETKYNSSTLETKTVLTPLGEWMDKAIKDIKQFFIDLPGNIIKGVEGAFNWINEVFNYFFGVRNIKTIDMTNSETRGQEVDAVIWSRFDEFVVNTIASIRNWFNDLPNKIRKGLHSIGSFFTKLYAAIDEFLFGKKITKVEYLGDKNGKKYVKVSTARIKSGFSKFLDDIIKEVKAFIIKIPEYVKEGIKGAGDIISAVVNALFGNNEDQNADPTKKVEEQIKKPFLGIDWTGIWNTIKEVGQTLINQVARIFTGTDDVEVNAEWFSNTVAKGIEWIKEKAEKAFVAVEEFIISIPTKIAEWFNGEGKTEKEQDKGPVGKALLGFAESVGNFIANIPNVLLGFVTNAITEIGKLWQKLYDAIINPQNSDEPDLSMLSDPEKAYYSRYIDSLRKSHKTKSAWDKFVENLGKVISKAFEELPVWVAQGVDLAIAGLNELIGKIGNWFSGSESKQIQSDSKESTKRAMDTVATGADAGANSSQTRLQAAFNNIGEHIKTLIITTLPKFISDAWTALKTLGSEIWAGFEAIFDDTKTVDTPVATAVRTLGDNVKKKIVGENGDGSDGLIAWINDAFIEIGKKGAEIWTGISNIFNGTPKTEFEEEVIKFGVWLGDFITIEIPKAIKKGFSAIAKLFNPTDSVEENLALLPDAERAYYSRYIDSLRKTNKKVEEETNKPGFWSFVSDIGDSLGKAFISVGPSILNGISTALEWLTHIGDILIDILSGKTDLGTEIEKAYGKEARPLKDALTRIGESIKKLLVETIPKMVGAAIVEINKYMTEAFSNLRTGMEEAAGEDGGSSKLFGDDDSFFGKIMNVFDQITQFATGDGAAIAMVVAFAYLLKQLKEAMSIADELEAATGVVKWSAITFAILGLSNILSSIMDVIKEGDPTKIEAAEKIIDKLGGLLNSVAWIMGLMSASKIVTALNELFGGGNGKNGSIKIDASKSRDAMINVTNTVEAVNDISSFWSKGLGALTTGAGVGFGSYLAGAGIKSAVEDITDGLTTSLTELMTSVDMVSDLLTPFIEKLTAAGDKVEDAKTAIDNIIDLFKSMFTKFGNLYEDVGGQAIKDLTDTNVAAGYGTKNAKGEVIRQHSLASASIAAFISDFSGIIDIYIAVANFIDSLSDALTKVGNVDSIDDKIKSITSIVESEAFSELIHKVFSNVYNLFTKLEGAGYNAVNYENLAQAFSVLADVMTIIAESMGGIDAETSKNFASGFDALKQLAEVFNGKDADLLKLGSRISSFGSHMRNFYKYVKEMEGFDAADVDATNAKVNSMVQIIKGVSDSVQNLSYYGEGFKFLPALGAYLPDLGTDLAGFIEQLNRAIPENISDDRLGTLSSVTSSLSAFLSSFGELGWLSKYNGFNYDDDYRKIIDSIYENLQSIINNPKNNQFGALAAQLYQIINNPLTSEEAYEQYRSAGSDIARELYAGIQAALDNPDNHYQPEIVPVLKLDGVDSQMRDYFTNHKFSPELDTTSVIGLNADTDAKLDEIKAALDSINESIIDLKNNTATTADVAKAIGGWTIKTNTGALVGAMTPAIDRAIGERIWLVQRRNTID